MTVKMCHELQEIYDYELSNGNVVENVVQNDLQESGCVTFKFPLKYDTDRDVNRIKLPKSISETINIEQKNITYYSSQYDQTLIAPFNSADVDCILCNEKSLYNEKRIKWFNRILILIAVIIVVVMTFIFIGCLSTYPAD
jgi:hypothetical protein